MCAKVTLKPAGEVPFASLYQHRTASQIWTKFIPQQRQYEKKTVRPQRDCLAQAQNISRELNSLRNWHLTCSPSCEARTSAGPHNCPSCAHCKASFFLPETRRFWTSRAIAYMKIKISKGYKTILGVEAGQELSTHPNLSFRRQILQAVAWHPILSATHLGRCKKFCNCWLRSITFLYQIQTTKQVNNRIGFNPWGILFMR